MAKKKQFMCFFLCTTTLLQLILTNVWEYTKYDQLNKFKDLWQRENSLNNQFFQLANQIGLGFQSHINYFSQQLQNTVEIFTQLFNPLMQFISFKTCEILTQQNYLEVCIYAQQNIKQLCNLNQQTQKLIGYQTNYKNFLPYLFVESVRQKIEEKFSFNQRFSILVYNPAGQIEICMINPANQISKHFINKKQHKQIQLSRPYINPTNNSQIIMSLQQQITFQDFSICKNIIKSLKISLRSIETLFFDINYYQSILLAITNLVELCFILSNSFIQYQFFYQQYTSKQRFLCLFAFFE
ncbi:unnamed protein product [Paramecium sonneborni]|uniref:Transmembrane protein n=1 Tax=Paramecium sonneborni TaxID=65129 RepID=A0A8S1KS90_9CILI|nr:unnamed protein product [Paramecium sonneborni]